MESPQSTMNAIWLEGGTAELRTNTPSPTIEPGWALVKVRLVGICGTDRQLMTGYAGFCGIPGHEFVGEVVAGSESWLGKRVVADINVGCGACAACGISAHHCEARRVLGIRRLHGALAEFLTLPETNLVAVPEEVGDAAAALAEPLAAALHVIDDAPPDATGATVFGDGALGHLVARALQSHDFQVSMVGRHAEKLRFAETHGIATTTNVHEIQREPLVVDCTGTPTGLRTALDHLSPGGTLILKSTHAPGVKCDLSGLVVDECRIVGSRCGDLQTAVEALTAGRVRVHDLTGEPRTLLQAVDVLSNASRPTELKALIDPRS
ncbi:MAG: alcohol dehydrogenase catalytic domain-containing protein [Acidobacteria bacterium]|nr:alcohol dehydrogenase catalytic domain-containing protein [Acidobacteriota bacterium]